MSLDLGSRQPVNDEPLLGADEPLPAADDPARYRLRLLDGFHLEHDGRPLRTPLSVRRVVAFLGVHGRTGRTEVAGTLWPEVPEHNAHASLRTVLWRLNRLGTTPLIAGQFFDGSEAEAFVIAVNANVTHGLPLSRADRHRGITRRHPARLRTERGGAARKLLRVVRAARERRAALCRADATRMTGVREISRTRADSRRRRRLPLPPRRAPSAYW